MNWHKIEEEMLNEYVAEFQLKQMAEQLQRDSKGQELRIEQARQRVKEHKLRMIRYNDMGNY